MATETTIPEPGTLFAWLISESLDAAGFDIEVAEPEPSRQHPSFAQ